MLTRKKTISNAKKTIGSLAFITMLLLGLINPLMVSSQVHLVKEIKITDSVMFFDGVRVDLDHTANSPTGYDYVYGNALSPHGDCVKAYKHFVFMTWYRGGKLDRHVMLSRYNMKTGVLKTIEFPHQHTGYNGKWWIGETHNTISVGICPKDSTVHMLYDLHRNGNVTKDNINTEDYLRYSFSETGGATVADEDFTLERFVNSPKGNYKHLSFNGIDNVSVTKMLTYPDFFTNDEGDLFMKNRFGYDKNSRMLFARYDGNKWHGYTDFNRSNANNYGLAYSWGIYGDIKYINGKIRIGFQRRSGNRNDKFLYQDGIFYAECDDPTGLTQWKDYKGAEFTRPLVDADLLRVAEPGNWVTATGKDQVKVDGFNWTVTDNDDVHFVCKVKDLTNNVTKKLHTFKSADDAEFTTEEFSAGSHLFAAGKDVYVIGLNGGRLNVARTEGGSNNFREIYQHTTGPTFDKGVPIVYEGKLYFHLKKSGGSGDKRTTYLQVFDLDIDASPADTSRYLRFKDLTSGQEVERESNLMIVADVGSTFKEVSLMIGDENRGTLTTAPFQWELQNLTERVYDLKLVATDTLDVTVERSITIYTPEVITLSDKRSVCVSFEDGKENSWLTDGEDYGMSPTIVDNVSSRSGTQVMALTYNDKTSGHHVQNIVDKIAVPDQYYFHIIAYTASNGAGTTFPTAKLGDWSPTPSFTGHAAVNVFERKVTSRQNTKGDSLNCYPRLRSKAGEACTIYYDDIVLYAHESDEPDLVAPLMAKNYKLSDNILSWSNGSDAETEITATLILGTTQQDAAAPELLPQVAYGTQEIDSVGVWKVLANIPADDSTFTVTSSGGDNNYAIVHRDLAYNYSEALTSDGGTSDITKNNIDGVKVFAVEGAIRIEHLKEGQMINVYDLSGKALVKRKSTAYQLDIYMPQGIYIVHVSGYAQKSGTKVVKYLHSWA